MFGENMGFLYVKLRPVRVIRNFSRMRYCIGNQSLSGFDLPDSEAYASLEAVCNEYE